MNQKKLIQIVIIAVIGVWVFCLSTIGSVTLGRRMLAQNTTAATAVPSAQTTAPTTTTEPTTTAPSTTRLPIGGNIVTSKATVDDPQWLKDEEESKKVSEVIAEVNKNNTTTSSSDKNKGDSLPEGKAEIAKAYVEAINKLKNTKKFSLYKDDKLDMSVDRITGGSLVQAFADSLISSNQKSPVTYNFTEGVDSATSLTPNEVIAPLDKAAQVETDAIASATAKKSSDGGYTLSIELVPETQTYTAAAKNHATMVEVVDITPLVPAGATVNSLEMSYVGTTIDATIDKEGRISSMRHRLCVEKCSANATYAFINVEMEVHGEFISNYTFSY